MPPADPHEQGQQRAAEAEAQQGLVGVLTVDEEDDRAAQQPEAVGQHAGDRAGAVTQLQRGAEAVLRSRGHAEIAHRGQPHADEPDRGREDRADQEGHGPPHGNLRVRMRQHRPVVKQAGDDQDEHAYHAELPVQIGVGPFANRGGNFLHLLGALRGTLDLPHQHQGVSQARQSHEDVGDQGNLLPAIELLAKERLPERNAVLGLALLLHRRSVLVRRLAVRGALRSLLRGSGFRLALARITLPTLGIIHLQPTQRGQNANRHHRQQKRRALPTGPSCGSRSNLSCHGKLLTVERSCNNATCCGRPPVASSAQPSGEHPDAISKSHLHAQERRENCGLETAS